MTDRQDDSGALREKLRKEVLLAAMKDNFVLTRDEVIELLGGMTAILSPQGSEPAGVGAGVQTITAVSGDSITLRRDSGWDEQRVVWKPRKLATPAPAQQAVTDWREVASEAIYVGLCIGVDCAGALADLQERGVYKPRCDDGKPSNANARRDADKLADIYRRGLALLRRTETNTTAQGDSDA